MKRYPEDAPDSVVEKSPTGGLNSKISGRYDLISPQFLARLAAVLEYGSTKYSPYNWMLDPPELHLSHAMEHLVNWNRERWASEVSTGKRRPVDWTTDGKHDELAHAACRILFMIVTEILTEEELEYVRHVEGETK